MLPPFIIEQIREREERERTGKELVLELPLPLPPVHKPAEDDKDRGVIVIDLS